MGGQHSLGTWLQDARLCEREGPKQCGAADHTDRHQVVQRPPGINHDDKLSARAKDPVNLLLSLLDIGHMMQHSMAEHYVEGVVGERQAEDASLQQVVVGQVSQREPGSYPVHGFGGQVDPGPGSPLPYQAFRIGPFSQTYLEHSPSTHLQGIEATREVPLVLIAKAVVFREESLVV